MERCGAGHEDSSKDRTLVAVVRAGKRYHPGEKTGIWTIKKKRLVRSCDGSSAKGETQ